MLNRLSVLAAASLVAALPAAIVTSLPATAQDLDLDLIFRCEGGLEPEHCAAAREDILNNCTVCHTFVPIVMQQWDENEWRGLLDRHVGNDRVAQLSEEEVEAIHAYLSNNFTRGLPPPELPPALLETWTSY